MKKGALLATFLLLITGVSAKEVTQQTARVAAVSFAASLSPLRGAPDVELVYTAGAGSMGGLRLSGYPLFYIYNVGNQQGFVLVAGDDTAYPVLGYADQGMFRTEGMPANLASWLMFYEDEIAAQLASGRPASAETVQAWHALLTDSPVLPSLRASFPTAAWDQLEPYSDLCPRVNGRRTYAGCVATAMGIAMKYHRWPSRGFGRFDYKTATDSIVVSATLGATYDWGNMLDVYTKTASGTRLWDETQAAEVARLIFHCAASTYTDFTTEWAAAYPSDALHAFVDNFGYDTGAYLAYRELYTVAEWDSLLREELDNGRILFYNGTSETAGHQFILDGYNSMGYYHVNWGWGGYANGNFRLTALNYTDEGAGYVYDQGALIGLRKPVEGSVPRYEFFYFDHPTLTFLGLRTDDAIITPGRPFSLYISPFTDYGFRPFTGYISLCLADQSGKMKELLEELRLVELEGGDVLADLEGDTYTITSPVANGDVIMIMHSQDGQNWTKVRGIPGAVAELPVGVTLTGAEKPLTEEAVTLLSASVKEGIILRSHTPEGLRDIRLYDMGGRLVKHLRWPEGVTQTVLSASDLQPANYVLVVGTGTDSTRFRIGLY